MTTGGTAGSNADGPNPDLLNGCDPSTAIDMTASPTATITFGDRFVYDPACLHVKVSTAVTWTGDFSVHPLQGGTVSGSTLQPDPTNPISAGTTPDAGSLTVTFDQAGPFGYYCEEHVMIGMKGAVFVTP
jgi:plastocyanin